jgi:hypothetical protein
VFVGDAGMNSEENLQRSRRMTHRRSEKPTRLDSSTNRGVSETG